MIGSYAVLAARAAKADAIDDLSGPASYDRADLAADAAHVTMPALFIFSRGDASDLAKVKAALPSMPTEDKRLIEVETGHGWSFFSEPDLVRAIQAWLTGDDAGVRQASTAAATAASSAPSTRAAAGITRPTGTRRLLEGESCCRLVSMT